MAYVVVALDGGHETDIDVLLHTTSSSLLSVASLSYYASSL